MEVILLEKYRKLGNIGDVVDVKNGYARNYLIPQNKALRATNANKEVFEAEVLESSAIDEGVLKKILLRAGRVIAQPALEGFELIMDNSTPPKVRLSIMGALTYLIVPFDLIPDFIPASGFSDDLVALTAVISLWQHHITPEIKFRAKYKLDKWFPL